MNNNIFTIINSLTNIDKHKLKYIICQPTLVQGLRDTFSHYGIEYTKEIHELLVDEIQTKLEGPDIEREWTKEEYETFVLF